MEVSPRVSVVALFDRGELEPCLPSLLRQKGLTFEVIAVVPDEHARDELMDFAKRFLDKGAESKKEENLVKTLVAAERNPAMRRNLAAARAAGSYLAFIDDDAFAPPDWLEKAVSFLDENEEYAGAGGPNLCPPHSGFRERLTDLVLTTPLIGAGSRAYRGGGETGPARAGEVHLVNLVVRKDWFLKTGGFNEALGYGGEDTDFLERVKQSGGRFAFHPGLIVYHRRRPFGRLYLSQRFRLRRQSMKVMLIHPRAYLGNFSFWLGLLGPAALAGSMLMIPAMRTGAALSGLAAVYSLLVWVLCAKRAWKSPELFLPAPLAFFLHHAAYAGGMWLGLLEILGKGPIRMRARLVRDPAQRPGYDKDAEKACPR